MTVCLILKLDIDLAYFINKGTDIDHQNLHIKQHPIMFLNQHRYIQIIYRSILTEKHSPNALHLQTTEKNSFDPELTNVIWIIVR